MVDNSTNLSEKERQELINICNNLKETNPEKIIDINKIIAYLSTIKYGLNFEKHTEEIDEKLQEYILTLKEHEKVINSKSIDCNFLIDGDNLYSLNLLRKTKNKVDMIYIDPPYNTLNEDFTYGDKMLSREDYFAHSKWLSFMEKRLNVAKDILASDGVIFISIDDNELYNLKLLCDKIFLEENFISNLVIETGGAVYGQKASNIDKKFVKTKDYILVYAKDKKSIKNKQPLYDSISKFDTHYSKIIINNKKITLSEYLFFPKKFLNLFKEEFLSLSLIKNTIKSNKKAEEILLSLKAKDIVDNFDEYLNEICFVHNLFLKYGIEEKQDNIELLMNIDSSFENYVYNKLGLILYRDYPFNKQIPEEIKEKLSPSTITQYEDFLLFITSGGVVSYYKNFTDGLKISDEFTPKFCRVGARGDLWKGFHQDMTNIDDEGGVEFKNGKKPIRLIKQLIKWVNKKDAIILDFFAGSGSTGEAVIELNKEDGGNRKFILCTNNEISAKRTLDYLHDFGYLKSFKKGTKTNSQIQPKINTFFKDNPDVYDKLIVKNKAQYEKYGICESITFPRLKTVITGKKDDGSVYSEGSNSNLKYFKINFLNYEPINNLKYRLCEGVQFLIELENHMTINNNYIQIVWDSLDLNELMTKDTSLLKIIYMPEGEIEFNEQQLLIIEKLKMKGIEFKDIPKYYYKEIR